MRMFGYLILRRRGYTQLFDRLVYLVGIMGPIMTVPQVWLIYSTQNAAGVSPVSWLMWAVFDIPWIIYGLLHREPPIVVTYTAWLVANAAVFVGALLY